jgi:hypothetical protein
LRRFMDSWSPSQKATISVYIATRQANCETILLPGTHG